MPIRLDIDDDDPLQKLREAETRLRSFRRETDRLRRLDRLGLLHPTLTPEIRAQLRAAYFAKGGTIKRIPAGVADGAVVPARWDLDRDTLIKNVREQIAAGRPLEAALSGTGLTPTEVQIEIEGDEE